MMWKAIEIAAGLERAALGAADAAAALDRAWREVEGPVRVLALGKAAWAMVHAAAARIARVQACLVVAPETGEAPGAWRAVTRGMVGDHPYPTNRSAEAGAAVAEFVRGVPMDGALVVLLSGGASALACGPCEGLEVKEIAELTKRAQLAGVDILTLNLLRRHCERIKGGGLARMCRAARVIVYVLSDVPGDELAAVASGPFARDATTHADALAALRGAGLELPRIAAFLARGAHEETLKAEDARFEHVVIASNALVARAVAAELARSLTVLGVELGVTGEASVVARGIAARLAGLRRDAPAAWVFGGEYTVSAGEGAGVGGPSQELAATVAWELRGVEGWMLWAYSTDGRDGPSEAAGAVVDGGTAGRAGADVSAALARHDSYNVLMKAGAVIPRRATGTNLNHVGAFIVW